MLLILIAVSGQADDLDPPRWRGQPGSTFQEWDFRFLPSASGNSSPQDCVEPSLNDIPWGNRGVPDKYSNPYQKENGICVEYKTLWTLTDRIDWLKRHDGREGVWKLNIASATFNSLDFVIPNKFSDRNASTEMQVQVIYQGVKVLPRVQVLILLPGGGEEYINLQPDKEYQSGILPENWFQRTFTFHSDFCPSFENIRVSPDKNDEIYIDKVVVDTICRN